MIQYSSTVFLQNVPVTVMLCDNKGVVLKQETYQINPKHRNGSPQGAQWLISNEEEVHMFAWAMEFDSSDNGYYWGVKIAAGLCQILGRTVAGNESKIARFVYSKQPIVWHGYPVDYINDPQHDCPPKAVLEKWFGLGIISKSKIAKLIQGKGWKD